MTPLENLATTVTQDLVLMWDDLNKPGDMVDLKFGDFFDIKFHALGHKVLQAEKFTEDVKLLGDKFIDSKNDQFYWDPKYHHNIPIDGWTMYASNCWDQIDSNKDLDLPTQQILVAKFKCDEILNNLYDEFLGKYDELLYKKIPSDEATVDYKETGLLMEDLKNEYLNHFELLASKYNQSIYEQKQIVLQDKIIDKYRELFNVYSKRMTSTLLAKFDLELKKPSSGPLVEKTQHLTKEISTELLMSLSLISMSGSINNNLILEEFMNNLNSCITKQQKVELDSIITKSLKRLGTQLNKTMVFEINDIKENTWDIISEKFETLVNEALKSYKDGEEYDFGLGIDKDLTTHSLDQFRFKAWCKFYQLIKKNLSKNSILTILKERFEEKFRYDENGLPRLYTNEFELEHNFNESKLFATKGYPLLTMVRKLNSTEILPQFDIFNKELQLKYGEDFDEEEEEEEDEDANKFAHIISEADKAEIMSKFKKETDAKYIETKRSLVQHITQIPYYIYLIIVVLGWNEFMAIIKSPLFFTFALLLGAVGYIMYQLNLIRPAMTVGQKMVEEAVSIGKEKLREFINDQEMHHNNLQKMSGKKEEIELEDMSREKTDKDE